MKTQKLLLLGVCTLLLAGCGKTNDKPQIDLSFDDAYKVFISHIAIAEKPENIKNMNLVQENLKVAIQGKDTFTKTYLHLTSSGNADMKNQKSNASIAVDLALFDDITNDTTIFSGDFDINKENENSFFKVNNFLLNKGEGNSSAKFINLLAKEFLGKRVKLDTENNIESLQGTLSSLTDFYGIQEKVLAQLKTNKILISLGSGQYDGYQAYKVGINTEALSRIIKISNPKDIVFDGRLILEQENQVLLVIEKLQINKDMSIQGNMGDNKLYITVHKPTSNERYNINARNLGKDIKLDIAIGDDNINDNAVLISSTIKPVFGSDYLEFLINGDIVVNALNLGIQSSQDQIMLGFTANYKAKKIENFTFQNTDNFLLLSQIIGDQFGIQGLVQDTNKEILKDREQN